MNAIRKSRSAQALKAALDILGPCHPHTAAYLMFRAAAIHLATTVGNRKGAELTYDITDDLATGETL